MSMAQDRPQIFGEPAETGSPGSVDLPGDFARHLKSMCCGQQRSLAGVAFDVARTGDGLERQCRAFPEGIPIVIWTAAQGHRASYPGDRGIRFEPAAGLIARASDRGAGSS